MKIFASYFPNNIQQQFPYEDIVQWNQILDISNIHQIDEKYYIDFGRNQLEEL